MAKVSHVTVCKDGCGRNWFLGPCNDPSQQMECGNGRCIYQELKCDNLDSCGDGTDESTDPPLSCGKTSWC